MEGAMLAAVRYLEILWTEMFFFHCTDYSETTWANMTKGQRGICLGSTTLRHTKQRLLTIYFCISSNLIRPLVGQSFQGSLAQMPSPWFLLSFHCVWRGRYICSREINFQAHVACLSHYRSAGPCFAIKVHKTYSLDTFDLPVCCKAVQAWNYFL